MKMPHPKLSQAHAWMLKESKWLRNHRKQEKNCGKKTSWTKERDSLKNRENIKRKWEVSGQKGWNFWYFSEDDIVHAAQDT